MRWSVLVTMIISATTAGAACFDISGEFKGTCRETFKNSGLTKTPVLQFLISQRACDAVEIKMTAQPSGLSTVDQYDLKKGIIKIASGESTRVYSGGAFGLNGFSGTTFYMTKNSGSVISIFNEYEKVQRAQGTFLVVNQHARGYEMICEIPAVVP